MKKWNQLTQKEKFAIMLAQKLTVQKDATTEDLERMMEAENFLQGRGLNSYDYNISKKKNYNELQPETLWEFLQ